MPYWHNQTHVLKLRNNHISNIANDWDDTLQISLFFEKTYYDHAYQKHAGWEAALNILLGLFSALEVQQTPGHRNTQILPAARQLQSQQWVTGMQNPRPLPPHAAPQKPKRLSAEVEITLSLLVSRTTEKMQAKNLCTHTFTHLLLILLSSKH